MNTSADSNSGRMTAAVDLMLIIGFLLSLKSWLLSVDAIWSYAGPISLLGALGIATWRLRVNGDSWASLGLAPPGSLKWTLVWTFVALVVTIATGILAQSLAVNVLGAPDAATQTIDARYQGRFDDLPGNLPAFLFWLATAWVVGGFTEEMLFRAALFSRFEGLLARFPFAAILAVTGQAILFGQQHYYYQGLAGWVATGAIGFVSGGLYLVFKRNLWPLVLSHGLSNTLGLTLLYFGVPV